MATATPSNKTILDQSEGNATTALYRATIGGINTAHYLSAFERFEAAEQPGLRWNWAAALLTLNWLAFRGLWGAALAYTGAVAAAALLVFGIGRLVLGLTAQTQWAWLAIFVLLAIAVPGAWGTAWFYTASRKRMAHALAANNTVPEACAMLQRNAATRARLISLGLLNAALLAGGVAVYLHLPAPQHKPIAPLESKAEDLVPATAKGPVVEESAALPPVALPAMQVASAPAPVASEPQPVASEPVPVVEPVKPVFTEKVAKAAKPSKPAPAHTPTPTPAAASEKTYLVNAGLFANLANAQNVRTTLADAGMVVITEEVTGTKGTFTRVRVGPFATREQAVAAVLKIRSLGLEAQVLNPQPPKTRD